MHISELKIRNYKNFLKAKFVFTEGINTLIGENGSGKTNAMHAIRLLLDESLSRGATNLSENDFCRAIKNWKGHWIIISADFEKLDTSEGLQLLRHEVAHMNGTETGSYSLFFRPKLEIRIKLYQLSSNVNEIISFLNSLTIENYEYMWTGRGVGNFLDDDIYQRYVGDFENYIFPNPEEDDLAIYGTPIHHIYQEVACTFVPALRDVVSELRSYRRNPILSLLRGMESTINIDESQKIIDEVVQLNNDISSLKEIMVLTRDIQSTLRFAVGLTYAPGVNIESGLPDSMEKLLQSLNLLVGDNTGSEFRGDLNDQSLGGANLIYIALKLLEYENKLSTDRGAHFLLIEEPESHIHTHIQKTLFSNISINKTQVIVTTHSTHISSASKISSVNILAKQNDFAEVYQPANNIPPEQTNRIERYLDAKRTTLLFAKGVLLVEGDAELILIPSLLKSVFGITQDEIGISTISMDSAFFDDLTIIFSDDRIKKFCAIVTDLDKSIMQLPDDKANDNEDQKHFRASEITGETRSTHISELVSNNKWLNSYYANHTFEIDFLLAGNTNVVVKTLNSIYKQKNNIEKSKRKLESTNHVESGLEVLRLAKKKGKGWLALLLAENSSSSTIIPDYILEALAFASQSSINLEILKQIGEYRINSNPELLLHESIESLLGENKSNFIKLFVDEFPDDILSKYYGFLLDNNHELFK